MPIPTDLNALTNHSARHAVTQTKHQNTSYCTAPLMHMSVGPWKSPLNASSTSKQHWETTRQPSPCTITSKPRTDSTTPTLQNQVSETLHDKHTTRLPLRKLNPHAST